MEVGDCGDWWIVGGENMGCRYVVDLKVGDGGLGGDEGRCIDGGNEVDGGGGGGG